MPSVVPPVCLWGLHRKRHHNGLLVNHPLRMLHFLFVGAGPAMTCGMTMTLTAHTRMYNRGTCQLTELSELRRHKPPQNDEQRGPELRSGLHGIGDGRQRGKGPRIGISKVRTVSDDPYPRAQEGLDSSMDRRCRHNT